MPTLSRAEYEISPPTDETYTGPRFEYAFSSKPVFPYNSIESCPNGAIYGSFKRGATSLHGSIQYPFELTVKEVNSYHLIDFQRTKEQLVEKPFNLSDYEVKPLPDPQLYTFQIKGYEESHPDTYMHGLGTIDDQNNFTGILQNINSPENLFDGANINIDELVLMPDCKDKDYKYYVKDITDVRNQEIFEEGEYFTAKVTSLPITSINLINANDPFQGVSTMESTLPESQLYKFHIKGYEDPTQDSYMLGLGIIDDQNRFTGNLKHPLSTEDLTIKTDYHADNDPSCAWCTATHGYYGDDDNYDAVEVTSLPITNISLANANDLFQGASPMPTTQGITEADITNIFQSNEQQVHNTIYETESKIKENINKLEYYKGYASGMNGLIEKVQNKTSLEHVVSEVQQLTNQFNGLTKTQLNAAPSYPNTTVTPSFLQGQITGITEGVQTLRGIDITKYIENSPSPTKQTMPDYPALSNAEREEHTKFVQVMQKNYPTADIENLNKLCAIASDMKKHICNSSLSTERFNSLTDSQEVQFKKLIEDLPGIKVKLPYSERTDAIKLTLPQGQINDLAKDGYSVPEIAANKLAPRKTNEFASPLTITPKQSR